MPETVDPLLHEIARQVAAEIPLPPDEVRNIETDSLWLMGNPSFLLTARVALAAGRKQPTDALADLRERFAALAVIEEYIGEGCDNASHNIREVLKGDDPRPNADRWELDYQTIARDVAEGGEPNAG